VRFYRFDLQTSIIMVLAFKEKHFMNEHYKANKNATLPFEIE